VRWPELSRSKAEEASVTAVRTLQERVDSRDSSFRYLLMGMFEIDPDKRITPREALRSPFLARQ